MELLFWAIKVKVNNLKNGEALAFYMDGQQLGFAFDKKAPAPALFRTKKEAQDAIANSYPLKKAANRYTFGKEYEPDKVECIRVSLIIK